MRSSPAGRIHFEDFAQVLGVMPENKYSAERGTYLSVAATLLRLPGLGEKAVHELLRRMMVNELLGNPDMHLKNMGLWYPDGVTAEFLLGYDIVAYAAISKRIGHPLRLMPDNMMPASATKPDSAGQRIKPALTPAVLRAFTATLDIAEKAANSALRECVKAATLNGPR